VVSARLSADTRWRELSFESEALRDNPLGDPHVRPVYVWAPEIGGPYPAVFLLQGFTGTAPSWFNVRAWQKSPAEQIDDAAPSAVVVLVDAFTAIGGSQFLDSPAIGRYHTYLCDELVPWIDSQFPTSGVRALHGHSSGGYGAMVNAMLRPDLFAGFATHAGDALFEDGYQSEFAQAVRALRDSYDGSYDRFWEDFRSRDGATKKTDHVLLNVYAMSAAYSNGELPFDVDTGELRDDVWARWLDWDPVRMARRPQYAEALRSMRAIWIAAGKKDEFHLDLSSVAFHRAVLAAGVDESAVHFELHDGGHFDAAWTVVAALRFLAERLA
jgi:S-formylglutathione hydrolase FrmB